MASENKMITLRSSDGIEFEVKEAVAMMSHTLSQAVDDTCTSCIPLPNVYARTLAKVLEYCTKHANAANPKEMMEEDAAKKLKEYDEAYVDIGMDEMYHLILAANYLDIKGLLELCSQKVADTIKGRKVEEVRNIFHITNDFTSEQTAQIKEEECPWAFMSN